MSIQSVNVSIAYKLWTLKNTFLDSPPAVTVSIYGPFILGSTFSLLYVVPRLSVSANVISSPYGSFRLILSIFASDVTFIFIFWFLSTGTHTNWFPSPSCITYPELISVPSTC